MSEPKFVRCSECRAFNEPRALFCGRCGASLYGPTHGGRRPRYRRITASGVTMGIALLLGLAMVTFILVSIVMRIMDTGEAVDPYSGQSGTPATVDKTVTSSTTGSGSPTDSTLAPVQVRPTAAVASSTLKSTATRNFGATNLLDGDLTTAWEEGADGPGLGEWVRLEFSGPVVVARLEIANGYQRDDERFQGNPRVKTMKVEFSEGTSILVDLADTTAYQTVAPAVGEVEWVKLVIVSVYPGSRWEDAALSEVRVYAKPD